MLDENGSRLSEFADVPAKVDTSPPKLDKETNWNMFQSWVNRWQRNNADNLALVLAIKRNHYNRGKVDCHWDYTPQPYMVYYYTRVDFLSRINFENKFIYDRIITTNPKVQTTASLMKDWERNRRDILERAEKKFVLFPLVPCEDMEDVTFASPKGVKRPRIYLTISHHKCSPMGELQVELFTDVCPQTCELFTELLMGDGLGYGYVGTSFFR
ncbi:uncharacterized protein LOC113226065 [Hyposmocoma kahamanoa]|uniref:uncharacterized protein LOC113226065 n=1 Tax=Hyposmocoma kahamanoa TaxID=1477025 RepID=UPI000E6D9A4F|nr:uncharacterized protein LOC113226065 [Hyposmocoma kahamanoa]